MKKEIVFTIIFPVERVLAKTRSTGKISYENLFFNFRFYKDVAFLIFARIPSGCLVHENERPDLFQAFI